MASGLDVLLFMEQLLNYPLHADQAEALKKHLHWKYSTNGFGVGCGKTPVAIALAETVRLKTLVVCPAYLRPNWLTELGKFVRTPGVSYKVVSYEGMQKLNEDDNFGCVIFDEAHALKNIEAKRTQAAHHFLRKWKPEYMLQLTATPVKNRVPEWWSLLKLNSYGNSYMKEFEPFSYEPWLFNTTFSHHKKFKIRGRMVHKFEGVRNRDGLINVIRQCYTAKTSNDRPRRNAKLVDVGKGKFDSAQHAAALMQAFMDKKHFMTIKAENAFYKVPSTIKYCKDLIDQDIRPVIFTDHVEAALAIAQAFKVPALTGQINTNKRMGLVTDFEMGKGNCLVASIGALKEGANIISTNHMVFNDYPWVPGDIEQAEGRIRRRTQPKPCYYHYLVTGKVDKMIYKQLIEKQKTTREATNVGG